MCKDLNGFPPPNVAIRLYLEVNNVIEETQTMIKSTAAVLVLMFAFAAPASASHCADYEFGSPQWWSCQSDKGGAGE